MKKMILCLVMVFQFATLYAADEMIIDSQMSFEEAILGTSASENRGKPVRKVLCITPNRLEP